MLFRSTDGTQEIMLFSSAGKSIRFHEDAVRAMGRTAAGVRGIKLGTGQSLISARLVTNDAYILTATEKGYGQRTRFDDYRPIGRGGQGVQVIRVNERNGEVIGAEVVAENDEVLLITDQGTMVRTRVSEISVLGRNTQGVRLIKLSAGEKLVGVEPIRDVTVDADVDVAETGADSAVQDDDASADS